MGEPISSQGNLADNFCGTSRFLPVKNSPFPLISRLRRQLPPLEGSLCPDFFIRGKKNSPRQKRGEEDFRD